jgi:hypothetical protein
MESAPVIIHWGRRMKWKSLGLVWKPDPSRSWQHSHAGLPTPIDLGNGVTRVFIYCQSSDQIGRTGYVDVATENPIKVIGFSNEPVLDIGPAGAFDDNGVVPVSVAYMPDGTLFLYYVGFEICHKIRYRLFTGLGISHDGGTTFRKVGQSPILDRSDAELFFRCGTHVVFENGRFRAWYVAGSAWHDLKGKAVPIYNIRTLGSSDGVVWGAIGKVVMDIDPTREHGFGRPYVVPAEDGGYEMFYSIRSLTTLGYRLGYATSYDGIKWTRRDEDLGFVPSGEEWDSKEQSYSAVVTLSGQRYMFYNGNNFGQSGFGIAVEET